MLVAGPISSVRINNEAWLGLAALANDAMAGGVKVASACGVEGRVGGGATLIKTKIERTNSWRVWRKYVSFFTIERVERWETATASIQSSFRAL